MRFCRYMQSFLGKYSRLIRYIYKPDLPWIYLQIQTRKAYPNNLFHCLIVSYFIGKSARFYCNHGIRSYIAGTSIHESTKPVSSHFSSITLKNLYFFATSKFHLYFSRIIFSISFFPQLTSFQRKLPSIAQVSDLLWPVFSWLVLLFLLG